MIGIDLFGDSDTRKACHQFFRIPDSASLVGRLDDTIHATCAGLPMFVVGGFSGRQRLVERLYSVCPPIGPSLRLRSQLQDPVVLNRLVDGCSIRVPYTCTPTQWTDQFRAASRNRWLLKEPTSSGGISVRWCLQGVAAPDDCIVQQWIPGRNFGATFLSDGAKVELLGICRSLFTRHRG